MKDKFAESEFLVGVPEKLGGAVCMHYDEKAGRGEFLWTHTTSSMGIAFQTTADREATTRMSRLPSTANSHQHRGGTSILVRWKGLPKLSVLSCSIFTVKWNNRVMKIKTKLTKSKGQFMLTSLQKRYILL